MGVAPDMASSLGGSFIFFAVELRLLRRWQQICRPSELLWQLRKPRNGWALGSTTCMQRIHVSGTPWIRLFRTGEQLDLLLPEHVFCLHCNLFELRWVNCDKDQSFDELQRCSECHIIDCNCTLACLSTTSFGLSLKNRFCNYCPNYCP